MVLLFLPSLALLIYLIICVSKNRTPSLTFFSIYAFIVTISILTLFCSILINLMEMMQILTGINSVFLGLTVFAWANCFGGTIFTHLDYLSITRFAALGNPRTAVAGIFSGQLFNFLLGFGISLFMKSLKGAYEYRIFKFGGDKYDIISDSIVVVVIIAGLVYLCWTFFRVFSKR